MFLFSYVDENRNHVFVVRANSVKESNEFLAEYNMWDEDEAKEQLSHLICEKLDMGGEGVILDMTTPAK